jgi:hypothetical protein
MVCVQSFQCGVSLKVMVSASDLQPLTPGIGCGHPGTIQLSNRQSTSDIDLLFFSCVAKTLLRCGIFCLWSLLSSPLTSEPNATKISVHLVLICLFTCLQKWVSLPAAWTLCGAKTRSEAST